MNKLFNKKNNLTSCLLCREKGYTYVKYKSNDFLTGKVFSIIYCTFCQNAFTDPLPRNLGNYYPSNYHGEKKFIGLVRKSYLLFQERRIKKVLFYKKKGRILDVGSGEGYIGSKFEKKDFSYQGIDSPSSKLENKKILTKDFLSYNSKEKYDIVTFWQSLEHFPDPNSYIKKARELLNKEGLLFIEVPSFSSIESRIFGGKWYHLSPPRHTVHLTTRGLAYSLSLNGFRILEQKKIFAFEYSIFGLIQSFLNLFAKQDKIASLLTENKSKSSIFIAFVFIFILFPFSLLFELLFFFLNSSPFFLSVARKEK